MFNSLIRLLDDSNLEALQNRLYAGLNNLKTMFAIPASAFEDKGDNYELTFDVHEGTDAKNVKVDYDDDTRVVTVDYKFEKKNFTSHSVFEETLPWDADPDTIYAEVVDGKVTITVDKKEEGEGEEVPDEDPHVIKINRKK